MAKKVILIVVGAVLMLCGLVAIVPGALVSRLTGSNGSIDTGYHTLGSPTPALVSPTENVQTGPSTTLTVTARDAAKPVFLGVAPAAQVDQFLDGVAYDQIREFQAAPYRVETDRHPGGSQADPPGAESFWVASATGTDPTLDWKVRDGEYRLVMMNADGSPGTSAQTQIGVTVEGLRGVGVGAVTGGLVAFLIGLGLLVWGIRTPRHPTTPPPSPAPSG